jgi:carbon-monoxide dehydrogenase iron sulfur subunit
MQNNKNIFVKPNLCTGCKSCEIACAIEHSKSKNLYKAINENIKPKSRIYVEYLFYDKKIPILCRHSEDAPCLHACIAGAITINKKGAVIIDKNRCIGCWTCIMECPYGVIGYDNRLHKAFKCDKCQNKDIPACVSACPVQALTYETASDYSYKTRKKAAKELMVYKEE